MSVNETIGCVLGYTNGTLVDSRGYHVFFSALVLVLFYLAFVACRGAMPIRLMIGLFLYL